MLARSLSALFSEYAGQKYSRTIDDQCMRTRAQAQYARPKLHVSFNKTHRIKLQKRRMNIMRWISKLDLCELAVFCKRTVYVLFDHTIIYVPHNRARRFVFGGHHISWLLNWRWCCLVLSWFVSWMWVCFVLASSLHILVAEVRFVLLLFFVPS